MVGPVCTTPLRVSKRGKPSFARPCRARSRGLPVSQDKRLRVHVRVVWGHAHTVGVGTYSAALVALVGPIDTTMIAEFGEEYCAPMCTVRAVLLVGKGGGLSVMFLAAVGVVRFDDVLARMHTLAKASTLGAPLMLFGAAISLDHPNDVTSLVLAGCCRCSPLLRRRTS